MSLGIYVISELCVKIHFFFPVPIFIEKLFILQIGIKVICSPV